MAPISKQSLLSIKSADQVNTLGGIETIAKTLNCDLNAGLPERNVRQNRDTYGPNTFPPREAKSYLDHLKEALSDETLRILVFSAVCSMAFGFFVTNDEGKEEDVIQGVAILLAVVVVSGVQSFQNWSKDKEFKSLAELRDEKRTFSVIRDGKEAPRRAEELVVGDLVRLASGDSIPGDGLLVRGFDCEVDESTMTGESEPVDKSAKQDCVLKGSTTLVEGEGVMMLTAVGPDSQMGIMLEKLQGAEEEDTPLQAKLDELAGQIGKIGTACGALTFGVLSLLWYLRDDPDKRLLDILQYFIIGVAIVVVAVPEGLPLAVTISLAFSMRRMMADKNLVRKLDACETMGSATVIASDKTGTLTENRMAVKECYVFGKYVSEMEQLEKILATPYAKQSLSTAISCNTTADLDLSREHEDGRVEFIRSPSECAMLYMLHKWLGMDYKAIREKAGEPLARRPFRKDKKYMSTIVRGSDMNAKDRLYISGAPEVVLAMCSTETVKGAEFNQLTEEKRVYLNDQVQAMASKGLRTLAVAVRPLNSSGGEKTTQEQLSSGKLEKDASLIGLFGLQDPLREGVADAVAQCKSAGIRVIMVTGDHVETARVIARECNIFHAGSLVLEGREFRDMTPVQQQEAAKRISVMARCLPDDKLKLVETLKGLGEVVAVTGDGTNDAPALKAADVGLAMGIAGTEVAKEAADIIIMDDRFSSIVASVRWGRSIKENIRKFLSFQLTINIVALTLTFVSACTSGGRSELPLKPVQLLWVNLIMDSFAALALATEPPSDKLMRFRPQGREESLITRTMFKNMIGHALYQTVLLLWMTQVPSSTSFWYLDAKELGSTLHDTVVFNTFVALQVFNLFNCRSVHDEWNVLEGFSASIVGQFILVIIILMQFVIVQFGGEIMQTAPLTSSQWASCVAIGASSVPVGFLLKLIPACEAEMSKLLPQTAAQAEQERQDAAVAAGEMSPTVSRLGAGRPGARKRKE